MFIVPMSASIHPDRVQSINSNFFSDNTPAQGDTGLEFQQIFQELIKTVEETEAATQIDAYQLSIGNTDDLHTMMINAAKADMALQTMVQLRNKMLDAYTEVMRTNL